MCKSFKGLLFTLKWYRQMESIESTVKGGENHYTLNTDGKNPREEGKM